MKNQLPPHPPSKVQQPAPPDRNFGEVVVSGKTPKSFSGLVAGTPDVNAFGPLKLLIGRWVAEGTGWNMIALTFQNAPTPPDGFKYRILKLDRITPM